MVQEGDIVLLRLPNTDMQIGKLRPALVLRRCSHKFEDWLVCMVSSQLRHASGCEFEIVRVEDSDFVSSGLKTASLIRIKRLATVDSSIFMGKLGEVSSYRVDALKKRISEWIIK